MVRQSRRFVAPHFNLIITQRCKLILSISMGAWIVHWTEYLSKNCLVLPFLPAHKVSKHVHLIVTQYNGNKGLSIMVRTHDMCIVYSIPDLIRVHLKWLDLIFGNLFQYTNFQVFLHPIRKKDSCQYAGILFSWKGSTRLYRHILSIAQWSLMDKKWEHSWRWP